MDNDTVVEQIVRSLSFEVEAIPQDNIIQLTTTTKSAPLNVKIRVRKKEEAGFKHGVLSLPKPEQPGSIPERVRLVSSDQTIMSFNVVMEADFQKPIKKPRKNILNIFKPTVCLGTKSDEDDYAYMPRKTYKAEINEESTSKSEGVLTKFTLAKDVDNDETSSPPPKRKKYIFGKCKPGGCLDPPFGEDRNPYSPAKETIISEHATGTERAGPNTESKSRTSSILSNKLFNWKKKSSNDDALDRNVMKQETKAEPVLDLFQAGSLQTPTTYPNTIMTYPPTLNSSELLQIQEKQRDSRLYNNISKNSFNVHSGSYFIMPKTQKICHDKSNNNKENYGDISDFKVDTIHNVPEDKKSNVQHKDLEDDAKIPLETKNSVTNVIDTVEYLEQSLDLKNGKDSNQKFNDNAPYDNHIILIKQPEETGLKNISLEKVEGSKELKKQDDQVIQNLNSATDSVTDEDKVNDGKFDSMSEYQSGDDSKPDGLQQSESVTIKKDATTDDQKSEIHEPNFEKYNESENVSQGHITEASNTGDKSVVTIDAEHEKSVYDISGVVEDSQNIKQSLENENKTSAESLGDKLFTKIEPTNEIPTPIERDTPLEMIFIENDDLKQIWKNETDPLISDSKFHTENELSKQIDKFNKKIDTLDELSTKETIDKTSNISFSEEKINFLIKDNVKDDFLTAIPNEYYTEVNKENSIIDYLDSQSEGNDLQESIEQNNSFEHSAPTTLDLIDNAADQTLQDISLESQPPTNLISAELEKNKNNKSFSQSSLEETTGLSQTKTSSLNTYENSRNATEIVDSLKSDDGTNESGQSKHHSEYIKEGEADSKHGIKKDILKEPLLNDNYEIQQVQHAIYDTITAKQNADKNKGDDKNIKKITFHDEFKADIKITEVAPETTDFSGSFLHEDSKSQTQTPEITSKNVSRPIIANIAIQSYIDDKNQVIIKSFDADNVPKRYPHDTVRKTKRILETDDKIQIPIDADINLYIEIKSNKQNVGGADLHRMEKDKTEKSKVLIKYDSEFDHVKRNITIAEDMRRTLEAVYEKELLPLRNTITELKNNMEMLTTYHMHKGHMFVRKPRSTKIVPLYRKCVCMKK